jgi:hypothetical protein
MERRGFSMSKRYFLMSLLALSLAPALVKADRANSAVSYRCVLEMEIKSPDSLARGQIDDESSGPLADVTLAANSVSVSRILSSVTSADNSGAPATSSLELSISRQSGVIQAVLETVISGPGLQKEQPHISLNFMNGSDPQVVTHGFVSRDTGITVPVETKQKRFLDLGEKTVIQPEEMKFSDAAFFDPLAGVDLQCALVR